MPCDDCKQAVAKLQADVEAVLDAFAQRQDALFDKIDATIDNFEAKNKTLLALVERHVRDAFARLEAATRLPPQTEEPPRRH